MTWRTRCFARRALPYALTMGRLQAGTWPSTVAESLVVEGRFGVAPGEDLAEARRAMEDAVAEAADGDAWLLDHPPAVEWVGAQFAAARTDESDPVVSTLAERRADAQRHAGTSRRHALRRRHAASRQPGPCAHGALRPRRRPPVAPSRREHPLHEDLVETARILAVAAIRFCGLAAS